ACVGAQRNNGAEFTKRLAIGWVGNLNISDVHGVLTFYFLLLVPPIIGSECGEIGQAIGRFPILSVAQRAVIAIFPDSPSHSLERGANTPHIGIEAHTGTCRTAGVFFKGALIKGE
ncbi:MAG: hypothetical protein ABJG29_00010, partial [Marinomonas sp.]